jgi:hypothetical protein
VPYWVIIVCAAPSALGTAAGGKRIIKTMGTKIIRISPLQGFAAETSGALTILAASQLGIPVSTTHCINACIMGVGASKRLSAVRWGVAGNIVIAWVLTLPAGPEHHWRLLHGRIREDRWGLAHPASRVPRRLVQYAGLQRPCDEGSAHGGGAAAPELLDVHTGE